MKTEEFEILLETVLEAVDEQCIRPVILAIHSLAVVVCRSPALKEKLASAWRMQAATCPEDVSGRHYLEWLAEQISRPEPPEPADLQKSLRTSLRLVRGKGHKEPPRHR